MKKKRYLLWLITLLTIFSFIIDLPQNFRLSFSLGPMKIDRIISRPEIDWHFGKISIKKDFSPKFGLDLSGGTHLVLEADMKSIAEEDKDKAFDSARDIVERRINLYGLTEPVIQQTKVGSSYRIIVEIPGISDAEKAIELIGKTAKLEFFEETLDSAKEATPTSFTDIWSIPTGLSGKNLKKSQVVFDPKTGTPEVALEFDEEGAKLFEEITKRNVNKTVAIFLDNQLLSAPKVNETISGGKAVIQGSFSMDEAKRLSIALNAGALPVPLTVIQQKNVGATLGMQSIDKSIIASIIGLVVIGFFMVVNYGIMGLVADVALIIYTLMTFAIFKLIPVTLTLAGIAGFILSIGMAVDANILIFERIKEEIRWGTDQLTAIRLGFDRAFPSIRDSNVSSLITCGILYYFGTGIVRGFAITLAIGIIVSLFSAITITRTFLRMVYK
mgnify:CR=1 FL=1